MSALYGMITVKSSSKYTELALESFFKNTAFDTDDQFVLIDNDSDWIDNHHRGAFPVRNIMVNDQPKNLSQNINQLFALAQENQQDLVFLSNDVVFTPGWNSRFLFNTVTVPACNQTHNYGIPAALNIDEFNNFDQLDIVALNHMATNNVPFERLIMPTYVVCIPWSVYSTVGAFDEKFNIGGEDVDYRLRCLQAGFDFKHCNSFLLHFNGKSSWNGAETMQQTQARNTNYQQQFVDKWGQDLFDLCITGGNAESVIKKYQLESLISQGQFNQAIVKVMNRA
jgi:GT2 family glycosyltransferase